MNAAAVDIGTNSMRLLVIDSYGNEVARTSQVTGLGTGVDATGRFAPERIEATLAVMEQFRNIIRQHDVSVTRAVATSASRDADNGREFMHEVAARLGVMPEIISGTREARLAFVGAIQGGDAEPSVVIDIGGGSTEFISGTLEPDRAISVDIGSVRLTDRMLPDRPASTDQLHAARELVADLIGEPFDAGGSRVIGVAGTFTSLAAVARGLVEYDRSFVHGSSMTLAEIDDLVDVMAGLTVAQTAAIPSMHPQRAPVILAGAVIAARALRAVGTDQVTVSEHDLLDALAEEARLKLG